MLAYMNFPALAQLVGDVAHGLAGVRVVELGKRLTQGSRHHVLLAVGHVGLRVSHPVDPGAVEKAAAL